MNINQVENVRVVHWMRKNGLVQVPESFSSYIAYINASVASYIKDRRVDSVVNQDDFTQWLLEH